MGSTQYLALKILVSAQNLASGIFSQLGNGLSNMIFGFKNLSTAGTIGWDAIKQGAVQAGTALWQIAGVLAIVGAAIALYIGTKAVQAAMAYQTAMTQLKNTTGSTDAQMRGYGQTIRKVSDDTGVAQTDLVKGMYQVISANFAGADASRILATATKQAVIAGVDQTKVTTGLVVSLNAFKLGASQADKVSNQMFKTLSLGRGQMGDLAGALQTGAALVHHYGVSYTDMSATLATLSTGGMKTFGTSMTGLTQLLNTMDGKTDMITKRMHKLGISFDETKFKSMDYQHQVAYLNAALSNNKGQTVAILGSKQAAVALGILGDQSKLLAANTKKLADTQQLAKEKAQAWADKQKDTAFQMQKLKTNVNNLLIDLGTQLLPIINKVIAQVGPLIIQFAQWMIKSGALQNALNVLAGALSGMITGLIATVQFFQHNQAALVALQATLIVVAGIIATLMVAALISWAMAAWTAAAGMIALTWPVLLVLAVIVLVVAGIILAVQHWGQITTWLQGMWNRFLGFLRGLWTNIVNVVKVGALLALAVILGPIVAIAALFIWLYNHNYYFKKLVDAIVGFMKSGIAWLQSAWQAATAFLARTWQTIVTGVSSMWGKISSFFSSAWSTYISKPLNNLWQSIVNFAKGWPAQAVQWGVNLIQGLINGITSMAGAIGNTAKQIATNIAGFLGFHSPAKQGPGRDLDVWGPNLVKGFSSGILKSTPILQSSLNTLMGGVGSTLSKSPGIGVGVGAGVGLSSGGGNTYINNYTINFAPRSIQTDKQLAAMLVQEISKTYRSGNNIIPTTSGGRSG